MLTDNIMYALETALGTFLIDKEHRVVLTCGIIHRHNEIPLTAGHPSMGRAILMQHHPRQRFAWPLLAMGPAPGRPHHLSGPLQPVLGPRVGAGSAMILVPALVKMFDGPACVPGLIQGHHLQDFVDGDRPG